MCLEERGPRSPPRVFLHASQGREPLRRPGLKGGLTAGQGWSVERPTEGLAGFPPRAASLRAPSDVFPGWSPCLDETDDFLGQLLLTAGRSNSD